MINQSIALANCNVLDVRHGHVLTNATIVLDGSLISDVLDTKIPSSGDYEVINCRGRWALPGIIDLHVHLCEEANHELAPSFEYDEDDFKSGLRTARNLAECLDAGITLVRDMGSFQGRSLKIKKAVEEGVAHGPRVLSCGHLLTYPGGHFVTRGREVRGVDQIRAAVREEIESGADFIKVASDPEDIEAQAQGGNPCFTEEEFAALVHEAHALGSKVACHTFPSKAGLEDALRAGADTLEHAAPLTNHLLEQILHSETIIVPTYVSAYDAYTRPEEALIEGPQVESIARWYSDLKDFLPRAIDEGVLIGIGSDAGFPPTDFGSAIREMIFLVQMGASNLRALQAATIVGARAIGMENSIGTIDSGKFADIIFVEQNPLESIETLRNIEVVVLNGKIVKSHI